MFRSFAVVVLMSGLSAGQAVPASRDMPKGSTEEGGISGDKLKAMETAIKTERKDIIVSSFTNVR